MQKGFIKYFMLTLFSLTATCVICNFIVDPLQYYRRNFAYPLYENDKWQVAAFIKSFSFDTAIVGTSMTQNFSLENIRKKLGGAPIKLSISGATIPEQLIVVKAAIRSGKLKKIIWGIDRCYFYSSKNAFTGEMPMALYERHLSAHAKYLLNLDMLSHSLRIILQNANMNFLKLAPQELETYNSWWQKSHFSKSVVLQAYNSALTKKKLPPDSRETSEVLESFLRLIHSHPEVEFILFFPPYSLAYHKLQYITNKAEYYEDMRFRKELMKKLIAIKNVKLFDFETDLNTISNLDNYKDLTHYSHIVNKYIVDCIAKNNRLVSTDNMTHFQSSFSNLPYQSFQ